MNIFDIIDCPLCSADFKHTDKSLICDNGHLYDISKSGYVNLLPPGKEKNSHTGDEKIMVKARTEFLKKCYYDMITERLAETVCDYLKSGSLSFADLGCGEGHHTLNLIKNLSSEKYASITGIGFDASKIACDHASKLARANGLAGNYSYNNDIPQNCLYFFPSNIFRLPVKNSSLDFCISMFAPVPWNETERILKNDGYLFVVSSAKNHLIEMRKIIYDEVLENEYNPSENLFFKQCNQTSLEYKISLNSNDDIKNLFKMTPFYYRTNNEGKDKLFSLDTIDLTISVVITVFRKS